MFEEGVSSQDTVGTSQVASFVEVMFARTMDEARECCTLLKAQDIDARIEGLAIAARKGGIAVLVPDDRFIEASEFLAVTLQDVSDEDEAEDDDLDTDDDDDDDDVDDLDDDEEDYPDDDDEEDTGTDDDV